MEIWLAILMTLVGIVAGALLTWLIGKKLGEIQQNVLLEKLRNAILDREHISVNEEYLMTELLAKKIRDKNAEYKPDVIFAVCPGGAMIAEWLSRRFLGSRLDPIPVQLLNMVPAQAKTNNEGKTPHIKVREGWTAQPRCLGKDSRVLLVNDISRTTLTMEEALDFLTDSFQIPRQNIQTGALICSEAVPDPARPTYYVAATTKFTRFDWKSYDKIDRSISGSKQESG